MTYFDRIEINPKIMMGKPVIKGTRIPVYVILNLLADGYTGKDIRREYPDIAKADILAALRFAAKTAQFEELRKEKKAAYAQMPSFLTDENLSPRLALWLRGLGYDVRAVREVGLKGKSDDEIIRWLREHKRILITSDLDFGEFFYWKEFGGFGVVILRSRSQGFSAFKAMLSRLHGSGILKDRRLGDSLLLVTDSEYRWRRFEHQMEHPSECYWRWGIKHLRVFVPRAIIEVDGGVTPEVEGECVRAGAKILVAASFIFDHPSPKMAIRELGQV